MELPRTETTVKSTTGVGTAGSGSNQEFGFGHVYLCPNGAVGQVVALMNLFRADDGAGVAAQT